MFGGHNISFPHISSLYEAHIIFLQVLSMLNLYVLFSSPKNCTDLWQKFFNGFAYQKPCDVPLTNYEDFAHEAAHDIPDDKVYLICVCFKLCVEI